MAEERVPAVSHVGRLFRPLSAPCLAISTQLGLFPPLSCHESMSCHEWVIRRQYRQMRSMVRSELPVHEHAGPLTRTRTDQQVPRSRTPAGRQAAGGTGRRRRRREQGASPAPPVGRPAPRGPGGEATTAQQVPRSRTPAGRRATRARRPAPAHLGGDENAFPLARPVCPVCAARPPPVRFDLGKGGLKNVDLGEVGFILASITPISPRSTTGGRKRARYTGNAKLPPPSGDDLGDNDPTSAILGSLSPRSSPETRGPPALPGSARRPRTDSGLAPGRGAGAGYLLRRRCLAPRTARGRAADRRGRGSALLSSSPPSTCASGGLPPGRGAGAGYLLIRPGPGERARVLPIPPFRRSAISSLCARDGPGFYGRYETRPPSPPNGAHWSTAGCAGCSSPFPPDAPGRTRGPGPPPRPGHRSGRLRSGRAASLRPGPPLH